MLFAYDPGQTTGWAAFAVRPNDKTANLSSYGEFDLWRGIEKQLVPDLATSVVYEMIVPRHLSFNPIGLQVIGVIRYLSEQLNISYVHQMNAQILGVPKWGIYNHLWAGIKSEHSKDAIQHGIVYLRKAGYEIVG